MDRKRILIWLVLLFNVVMFIYNMYIADFDNGHWFWGPISNIFFVLSMIITLRDIKKQEQQNS